MRSMSSFLNDPGSVSFLSFIIGLGFSILAFHKPFSYQQYLAMPVSKIEGKQVRHGGKCYTYRAEDTLYPLTNKHG